MRLVVIATASIAVPTLRALAQDERFDVVGVVTQPDRPKGRKQILTPTPVKREARVLDLPVLSPGKIGEEDSVAALRKLAPDLLVVAAYGQHIPPPVLAIPLQESVNLHPSLLPKYRGAAPIQMALVNGETETGVSIIYVANEMDAGDIILQESILIDVDDTSQTLEPRLAALGAFLMVGAVGLIMAGEATRTPQDHTLATTVMRLTKEDGRINWSHSAVAIRNRNRGFVPWPGTFCEWPLGSGQTLKIWRVAIRPYTGTPGEVIQLEAKGPVVATGDGALCLLELQPPGKRRMDGAAFLSGYRLQVGDRMG